MNSSETIVDVGKQPILNIKNIDSQIVPNTNLIIGDM